MHGHRDSGSLLVCASGLWQSLGAMLSFHLWRSVPTAVPATLYRRRQLALRVHAETSRGRVCCGLTCNFCSGIASIICDRMTGYGPWKE